LAYTTIEKVVELYGERYVVTSADRNLDGLVDSGAMQEAIDNAASTIELYIPEGKQIKQPAPDVFEQMNADIAIYFLSAAADAYADEKYTRFKFWIDQLKLMAEGKLGDGMFDPKPVDGVVGGVRFTATPRRFFGESLWRTF
jgi:phage gp36-like protein